MRKTSHLVLAFLLITACVPLPAERPQTTPVPDLAPPTPTLALPTPSASSPSPTPTPRCEDTAGSDKNLTLADPTLPAPLFARVHLPPCFDPTSSDPYPVVYLLHGQGFASDQWQRLGAPPTLDRLVAAGRIQPLILVLPEESDTLANPFESAFGPALIETLLPAVESAYPTCTRRECRTIGGLSRGASWAIYLAFSHPELFIAAGAHSLPPFVGLEKIFPDLVSAIPAGQHPAVSIDIGRSDPFRAPAEEFERFLTDAGVPHEWYLHEGQHNEAYWSAHVESYLLWYAQKIIPMR
jgi:enterochelin esterase-like enzyme